MPMDAKVQKCPHCGGLLTPGRFARAATCAYCGAVVALDEDAVSADRIREALRRWREDGGEDPRTWCAIGGDRWVLGERIASGEIADVYYAERQRPPVEKALVKILRDPHDAPMLAAEWAALQKLRMSTARGVETLLARIPAGIAHGPIAQGAHAGREASVLRFAPRFEHTLEAVRASYPAGVDARVGVWMWRRILEVLSFLHRSGVVHGALLPPHLLVERGEHGLRLVGYGCAGSEGAPLAAILARHEDLYPAQQRSRPTLERGHDLAQSAATIAYVLGRDGRGRFPSSVPSELGGLLEDVAHEAQPFDAWELWTRLGTLARDLFGPPSFHPLALPAGRNPPGTR